MCIRDRDLNYESFFSKGTGGIEELEDYTSHNTERLDVEGMKALLLQLEMVREDVKK